MRSLGGGDEIARSRLGRSIRKLTISCPAGWDLVLFFRNADKPASDYSWATRDRASALRLESGSEMAPQAIEIAQNGLADPAARNHWKENRSGEFPIMGP
jgi:hypothetical protein